jgi:hypothetical protein
MVKNPHRFIYCCQCEKEVEARFTRGGEIYPHRPDLHKLPFWKCDTCKNYVGCHHKTTDYTKPLGAIPNKEMKNARQHIHKILDPIWKEKKMKRSKLYARIAQAMGVKEYHTAELRTLDDARKVYALIKEIAA